MSSLAGLMVEKHSDIVEHQGDRDRMEHKLLECENREKALKEQREFLKHFQDVQFPTYKERTKLEALAKKYFQTFEEEFHEVLLRKIFVKSGGWRKWQEIEMICCLSS